MEPKDLTEKMDGKGVRGMAVGSDDLMSKSTGREAGVTADRKNISQMAAAAVAVALNINFSSDVSAKS
jgi:hypothetical protein